MLKPIFGCIVLLSSVALFSTGAMALSGRVIVSGRAVQQSGCDSFVARVSVSHTGQNFATYTQSGGERFSFGANTAVRRSD